MKDPPRLRELLDPVTARFGMEGASSAGAVWSRWTEVVGDSVARHAEPTSLRGGVLRVRTDSPAWATEIGYLVDEIRARANEIAGRELVREIRVWTSNVPIAHRSPGRAAERAGPSEHDAARPVPNDPASALERARAAWERWLSKGPRKGS